MAIDTVRVRAPAARRLSAPILSGSEAMSHCERPRFRYYRTLIPARSTPRTTGAPIASADGRAKVGKGAKSNDATNYRRTARAWSVSWLLICASLRRNGDGGLAWSLGRLRFRFWLGNRFAQLLDDPAHLVDVKRLVHWTRTFSTASQMVNAEYASRSDDRGQDPTPPERIEIPARLLYLVHPSRSCYFAAIIWVLAPLGSSANSGPPPRSRRKPPPRNPSIYRCSEPDGAAMSVLGGKAEELVRELSF